jgi:hypothetical protein
MTERCYINQHGYSILSSMAIDESKLVGATVITDIEEAERRFKEANSMDENDDVFIPSVFEKDGVIYGEDLNACAYPIEESSAEDYINNYEM